MSMNSQVNQPNAMFQLLSNPALSEFGILAGLPQMNSPYSSMSSQGFPGSEDPGSGLGYGTQDDGSDQNGGIATELSSLLAQVASLLPGLLQNGGTTAGGADGGCAAGGTNGGYLAGAGDYGLGGSNGIPMASQSQTPYSNFQASSQGDPHLSFNGTTQNGGSRSAKWDNMQSHHNLLSSNSFQGGYRVSNQTTVPQGDGKTMNGAVDIHTNFGKNDIRYDANGNASVNQNGSFQNINPGTNLILDDGTMVTDNLQNQLTVSKTNEAGGKISTTLSSNGQGGVDVSANGQNIDAGGYLARDGFTS